MMEVKGVLEVLKVKEVFEGINLGVVEGVEVMEVLVVMGVIEDMGFMGVTDIDVNGVMGVWEVLEVDPCLTAQGRSPEDLSSPSFQHILQAFFRVPSTSG